MCVVTLAKLLYVWTITFGERFSKWSFVTTTEHSYSDCLLKKRTLLLFHVLLETLNHFAVPEEE